MDAYLRLRRELDVPNRSSFGISEIITELEDSLFVNSCKYACDAFELAASPTTNWEHTQMLMNALSFWIRSCDTENQEQKLWKTICDCWLDVLSRCDGSSPTLDRLSEVNPGVAEIDSPLDEILNPLASRRTELATPIFAEVFNLWLKPFESDTRSLTVIDFLLRVRVSKSDMNLYRNRLVLSACFDIPLVRSHLQNAASILDKRYGSNSLRTVSSLFELPQ